MTKNTKPTQNAKTFYNIHYYIKQIYIYTAIISLYKGTCSADKCIGLLVPINVEHFKIYINAKDVFWNHNAEM